MMIKVPSHNGLKRVRFSGRACENSWLANEV
jgi:hypothetical protein